MDSKLCLSESFDGKPGAAGGQKTTLTDRREICASGCVHPGL